MTTESNRKHRPKSVERMISEIEQSVGIDLSQGKTTSLFADFVDSYRNSDVFSSLAILTAKREIPAGTNPELYWTHNLDIYAWIRENMVDQASQLQNVVFDKFVDFSHALTLPKDVRLYNKFHPLIAKTDESKLHVPTRDAYVARFAQDNIHRVKAENIRVITYEVIRPQNL